MKFTITTPDKKDMITFYFNKFLGNIKIYRNDNLIIRDFIPGMYTDFTKEYIIPLENGNKLKIVRKRPIFIAVIRRWKYSIYYNNEYLYSIKK